MLNALRLGRLWLLLAGLLLMVAACKKKDDPQVQPDPVGSFDATFTPAGSISFVSVGAQGNGGSQTTSGQPDATGYVKVGNLAPGNYVLTFNTTTSDYATPTPQNITIKANTNVALGTIFVDKSQPAGNVSYPTKGVISWNSSLPSYGITKATSNGPTGSVVYNNGSPSQLSLTGTFQNGSTAETVTIGIPYYGGPGQYTLGNQTFAGRGTYLRTQGGAVTHSLSSDATGAQGTLTVTSHNTSMHIISGTFGFNLYNNVTQASGTITNGTFSVTY